MEPLSSNKHPGTQQRSTSLDKNKVYSRARALGAYGSQMIATMPFHAATGYLFLHPQSEMIETLQVLRLIALAKGNQ